LFRILEITSFFDFLNSSHIKITFRKTLRFEFLNHHNSSNANSVSRHTLTHIFSISNQTICTCDFTCWYILRILLDFESLSVNYLRIRSCHIRIIWTFLVCTCLSRTKSRDIRKLAWRKLNNSCGHTVSTLQPEFRCFDVRFGTTYNNTAYYKKFRNQITCNTSYFSGNLVTFQSYLPFYFFCCRELLFLLLQIYS
jgi:hypothetical protein